MTLRLGLGLGSGVVGWIAFLLAVLMAVAAGTPPAVAALGGAIPAAYRRMLEQSARQCPALPPGLLAAQLQAESDFNPDSVSRVGAMGIAQFMPGTWVGWGRDVDGNGRASPFDPADAIDAQVRFMCDLHRTASSSGIPGDPLELALAGYNAGWGAVRMYGGIPPYAETKAYVARIVGMRPQFEGSINLALPTDRADQLAGGLLLPRANPRGTPQAVEWAMKQASSGRASWYNLCLRFVAQSYGWNYSGTDYAIDQYREVIPEALRHPGDRNAPPGALMFWTTNRRPGHVALSLGNGLIASNDIDSPGRISIVPAGAPERRWGAHYVGWAAPYFPNAR